MFGVAALPTATFADAGGTTNTFSSSTITKYTTVNLAASQQVDTFSTQIIGLMQGGATLYNQTFNVAFADPLVQASLGTAEGALTGRCKNQKALYFLRRYYNFLSTSG